MKSPMNSTPPTSRKELTRLSDAELRKEYKRAEATVKSCGISPCATCKKYLRIAISEMMKRGLAL